MLPPPNYSKYQSNVLHPPGIFFLSTFSISFFSPVYFARLFSMISPISNHLSPLPALFISSPLFIFSSLLSPPSSTLSSLTSHLSANPLSRLLCSHISRLSFLSPPSSPLYPWVSLFPCCYFYSQILFPLQFSLTTIFYLLPYLFKPLFSPFHCTLNSHPSLPTLFRLLSFALLTWWSARSSAYLSVFAFLPLCMSVRLSAWLLIRLPVYLSIWLAAYPSVCLPALSVCRSACLKNKCCFQATRPRKRTNTHDTTKKS